MAARYKSGACPRCLPEPANPRRGAILDRTYDDEGRPVWKCRNCWCEQPRRERAVRPLRLTVGGADKPTAAQVRVLDSLPRLLMDRHSFAGRRVEVYGLSVTLHGHDALQISARVHPEGWHPYDAGSVHVCFFIGPRGNLYGYRNAKRKNAPMVRITGRTVLWGR